MEAPSDRSLACASAQAGVRRGRDRASGLIVVGCALIAGTTTPAAAGELEASAALRLAWFGNPEKPSHTKEGAAPGLGLGVGYRWAPRWDVGIAFHLSRIDTRSTGSTAIPRAVLHRDLAVGVRHLVFIQTAGIAVTFAARLIVSDFPHAAADPPVADPGFGAGAALGAWVPIDRCWTLTLALDASLHAYPFGGAQSETAGIAAFPVIALEASIIRRF